jgi:hypothetical protein
VIAYKFLATGSVAPFTGHRWPLPQGGGPGAWVEAPASVAPELGVHGCRVEDLPYWVEEELWRIELRDPVRIAPFQLQSDRGRLVERVVAWNAEARRAFSLACVDRTRDLACEALRNAGHPAEADALAASSGIEGVERAALALTDGEFPQHPRHLAGYCVDAARHATHAGSVSHVAAIAGAELRGDPKSVHKERAWQARWLRERLRL